MLSVVKNQNGGYIQDGVENVYIFHPIFSKIKFWSIFLLFLFTLSKNKTFIEEIFLENSKCNIKDEIFQKNSRFYYSTAAQ
jgi:hypothetical protein